MSKEILKPLADWDYANLTKNVSLHGGVKQFVNNVYNSGIKVGIVGTLVSVGIMGGVGYGCKFAYDKFKQWQVKENKRKEEIADKLIDDIYKEMSNASICN